MKYLDYFSWVHEIENLLGDVHLGVFAEKVYEFIEVDLVGFHSEGFKDG